MGIVVISLILFYKSDRYKYPPGPVGLPILGSLPWLAFKDQTEYIVELHKKYGSIFMIKIGSIKNIVINDYETIKDFSNHPDFQDRPKAGVMNEFLQGYGVVDAEAFNKRFDYNDPEFIVRLESLNTFTECSTKTFIMSLFPSLTFIVKKYHEQIASSFSSFISQAEDVIKNHKGDYDENNPRDLIDLFFMEMKKSLNDESQAYLSTFTERQLKSLIVDLFIAGTETTSTTLRWAVVYMLHHPEIQQKIHTEIDEIVGPERPISMEDKSKLPLTLATLQEAERLGSIVPWGIPRSNSKPAEFKGYKFPPRCVYLLNFYGLHRDKKLWKNPEKFDPTRFIDSNGKTFRPPYLMPFGSGKRYCAGESLARMETFLLFATLMQNFKLTHVGKDLPTLKPDSGGFRTPRSYSICAKPRN
ncbi:Cytochrome P450 18a1 [Nymphon striatum]|nr:Cytochrome P450 18a1 [Nymphon striatum]